MKYRKLSESGDYVFGNGQLDFLVNTPDMVAQKIKTRLLLWLGEWFLDVEEGTAWLQGVLGKQQESTRDTVIRTRILETEGVTSIVSYESIVDADNRRLSVSLIVDTIYGETTLIQVGL